MGVLLGAAITLRGCLVDVSAPDGWRWRSSRTRTDNGAGACELMWVDEVMVEGVCPAFRRCPAATARAVRRTLRNERPARRLTRESAAKRIQPR